MQLCPIRIVSDKHTHTLVYIYRWIHDSRVRLRPVQPFDRYPYRVRVGTTANRIWAFRTRSRIHSDLYQKCVRGPGSFTCQNDASSLRVRSQARTSTVASLVEEQHIHEHEHNHAQCYLTI